MRTEGQKYPAMKGYHGELCKKKGGKEKSLAFNLTDIMSFKMGCTIPEGAAGKRKWQRR